MKPLNLLTHLKSCWTEVDWFNKEESRASDVPLAWLDSQKNSTLLCNARLQISGLKVRERK